MRDPLTITQANAQERLTRALRLFVGPGRPWSAPLLAETIEVDERTVRSWMEGHSTPCTYKLLRLAAVLGPVFTSHVLEPAGQAGRVLEGDGEQACTLTINAKASQLVATIAGHLEDGRLCSKELEEQRELARDLRNTLDVFLQQA